MTEDADIRDDNLLEITEVRRTPQGDITSAVLSDGSSLVLHPAAALEFSLGAGSVLSGSDIETVQHRSTVYAARDKAVEYLARREHSGNELILKLRKKGFGAQSSREAVDLLRDRGYVDDRRFASMWVASRLKKHPEGRGSLAAGLARRGVPRVVADEVLNEQLSEQQQEQALADALNKYVRTRSTDPRKVLNHLLRRGFKYADIKRSMAGLDEFIEETGTEYSEYD